MWRINWDTDFGCELGKVLFKHALLKQCLGFDLEELDLNQWIVDGLLPEPRQRLFCLFVLADFDQPSRGKGHPPNTNGQQNRRDALYDGWESPRKISLTLTLSTDIVASVSDPETEHDPQDGGELVKTDNETSRLGRRNLRIVERTDTAVRTNPNTREETARIQELRVSGRGAAIEVTPQDGPQARAEHGVLAREDLAQ